MNPWKQFWALFKFQALSGRLIQNVLWASLMLMIVIQGQSFDLDTAISNAFVVLIIGLLFGMMLLTSDNSTPPNRGIGNATQFLITRAIDRNILYRSKATLLYLIVLVVPVAIFLFSLKNPDLQMTMGSGISPELFLSHVPGSTLVASKTEHGQPLIFIPSGNLLIAGWRLWTFLMGTLAIQLLFLIRLKRPSWLKNLSVFGMLFFIVIWVFFVIWAVFIIRFWDALMEVAHFANNRLFFSFAAHQPLFWILTAPALIFGHLWCERRFARLEQ